MSAEKKTASAQGKASRGKGRRLEQWLNRWVTERTGWTFERTQARGLRQRGEHGDLACTSGGWPFFTECKNREGDADVWNFHQVLQGKGPVERWWKEAVANAEDFLPLLVFTRNRVPVYAMVSTEGWTWWCDHFGQPPVVIVLADARRVFPMEQS